MSIYYEMFREFSQSGYDLLTYYISIVKRRISLVLIVQEHLSTPRVFWDSSSSIFSSRCSVDYCSSFCPFVFDQYIVCPSSYGFWLLF